MPQSLCKEGDMISTEHHSDLEYGEVKDQQSIDRL